MFLVLLVPDGHTKWQKSNLNRAMIALVPAGDEIVVPS